MGKKRRYIQRPNKFGKKAFVFLDKLDGNAADGEMEEIVDFIDTIVVTDNQNQTIAISGRVLGSAADITDDGVEYSIDGGAFVAEDSAITDDSGVDKDRFLYSVTGIGEGAALSVGTHTITVRPKGNTATESKKTRKFKVRENYIEVNTADAAFADDTDGNITFTKAQIFASGKQVAGSTSDVAAGTNGWTITARNLSASPVVALDVTDAIEDVDVADYAGVAATPDLLVSDVADGTIVEITVTPKDSSNNLLTASAVTFTKTVTA